MKLTLLATLMVLLCSCKTTISKNIIGTWESSSDNTVITLTFDENKSCLIDTSYGTNVNIKTENEWRVDKNIIILKNTKVIANNKLQKSNPSISELTIIKIDNKSLIVKTPESKEHVKFNKTNL